MSDVLSFLSHHYLVIKSLHIIFVISWMAALFYLPRLFAYHADQETGSAQSEIFKVMERKLSRIIMTPAMTLSFVFGVLLLLVPGIMSSPMGWLHAKIFLVLIMSAFHGYMMVCLKKFAKDQRPYSSKTFKVLNEIPPLLMVFIVFLVVIKPF